MISVSTSRAFDGDGGTRHVSAARWTGLRELGAVDGPASIW
ncbi:hypothetical protein [Aeromicrobium fastidiosum]|nr:hypothetical protein [Aeromicrobium fastidiosum]MBP2389446.1 hypothetical protein [Aeromicrobium fastidiosum]